MTSDALRARKPSPPPDTATRDRRTRMGKELRAFRSGRFNDPLIGTRMGDGDPPRYVVKERIGQGGMGAVYGAEDTRMGNPVAIKVLFDSVAAEDDTYVERFRREATTASRIQSPHVVNITDLGLTPTGTPFFVMEHLEGVDLGNVILNKGHLSVENTIHIIAQALEGLGEAHAQGITHRDLKPENIFLVAKNGGHPLVKLLDFGLAKVAHEARRAGEESDLTMIGQTLGTPQYMSPEQVRGGIIDHRADIYSVGIILYEMLTGHVPFDHENALRILDMHSGQDPISPLSINPKIPKSMEGIILRALEKDPGARFQDTTEMLETIRSCSQTVGGIVSRFPNGAVIATVPVPGDRRKESRDTERDLGAAPSVVVEGDTLVDDPITAQKTQILPVRRSGSLFTPTRIIAGVGALVSTVAVFALVTTLSQPSAPNPKPAPVAAAAVAPVATPKPPPVTTPPPEKQATHDIIVRTPGPGAQVFQGEENLGETPLKLTFKAGTEPTSITLRRPGYRDLTVELVPDQDQTINPAMEALPKPEPKRKAAAPKPRPKPRASAKPKPTEEHEITSPF